MRNTARLLSLGLMAAGVFIAVPAFLDWIHLIVSGNALRGGSVSPQVEPTLVQFVIGGLLGTVGLGLWIWKFASANRVRNATYHHGDIRMGDTYRVGQAGAVGPNAHADHMTFNQIGAQIERSINLSLLADELSELRRAMMKEATEAEHSIAVGEVAKAEQAARAKDSSKVAEHLKSSGKWALDVASKIGIPVAIEALKRAINIP